MGFLSGLADTFGFGDGGAGDAANQIQAANAAAAKTRNEAFGTTEASLLPFADAGAGALPGLVQGSSVGGFDQTLKDIFNSDFFRSLVEERGRSVEGLLSASGQLRSGAGLLEAARVPTDIGLMIEQLLNSRQQGLVSQGLDTSLNLGNFRGANAGGVANLQVDTGAADASAILSGRQTQAAGVGNTLKAVSTAASLFSDRRLKTNIRNTGEFKGLKTYVWDWIEGVKDTIVEGLSTIGFMADEVRAKYPRHVYTFGGFDVIDYPNLIKELEEV